MSTQLINRTERLATIEKLLFRATSGMRVVEIAETCEVDRRTIYRDLALLREIGVPVYQKDGRYYLHHEHYVATLRLNIYELAALYIAARALDFYVERQNPHIISALKKLSKTLPDSLSRHVSYMIDMVRENPVDRAFVSVLETLIRAWAEERKVRIWCRNPKDKTVSEREFAVYFIEPSSHGGMYVVGYDYSGQHVVTFRLEWITRVQLLNEAYQEPLQFEREPFLASAWGIMRSTMKDHSVSVVLAFSPEFAPLVKERVGEAARRLIKIDGERHIVRLQVADWRDLIPWIRSWGSAVEVLEPKSLRDYVASEVSKLAHMYGQAAPVN